MPLLEGVSPPLSLFVVVCLPAGKTPAASGLLTAQLGSFGPGLCLPPGPLLGLSEPYWVAWPHGVKVSSTGGDICCGSWPSSDASIISECHPAVGP